MHAPSGKQVAVQEGQEASSWRVDNLALLFAQAKMCTTPQLKGQYTSLLINSQPALLVKLCSTGRRASAALLAWTHPCVQQLASKPALGKASNLRC